MPRPAFFDAISSKMQRADENLENLRGELAEFIPKHYSVTKDTDEPGSVTYRVRRNQRPGSLDRFSVLSGEIVHQLRSIFDHIAWQVAPEGLRRNAKAGTKVTFPVCSRAKYYKSPHKGVIPSPVKGADALIESLQPYHRGDKYRSHPLWVMHQLDIIDKHRLLVVVRRGIKVDSMIAGGAIYWSPEWIPLDDDTAEVSVRGPVNMQPEFRFEILFAERWMAKREAVTDLLHEFMHFTDKCVDKFAALFN